MNKQTQIEHLGRLLHMEVHMVAGYDSALERVDQGERRRTLESLRDDHERHVLDVTELLREMGEPAPGPTPDVDSLFAPSVSALKNADSAEDVLQAIRIAEQVIAGEYIQARDWGVGLQVHELLARNDADEQRHISAITDSLGLVGAARARRA